MLAVPGRLLPGYQPKGGIVTRDSDTNNLEEMIPHFMQDIDCAARETIKAPPKIHRVETSLSIGLTFCLSPGYPESSLAQRIGDTVALRRILELGKAGEFFPTPLPHRVGQIALEVADASGAAPRKSRRDPHRRGGSVLDPADTTHPYPLNRNHRQACFLGFE
jgi:hypothetical protein